jgi:hypothetical protein
VTLKQRVIAQDDSSVDLAGKSTSRFMLISNCPRVARALRCIWVKLFLCSYMPDIQLSMDIQLSVKQIQATATIVCT